MSGTERDDHQRFAAKTLGELYRLVGDLIADVNYGRVNTAAISATALDDVTQRALAALDAWVEADEPAAVSSGDDAS